MKRQKAEAVLNRFFEECGSATPAKSEIDPVLDRVRERLEWRAEEFPNARIPAASARPSRFVWAMGVVMAAILINVVVWRQGPPFPAQGTTTGKAGEHSILKSSSQRAGETLQIAIPQDAFELASVKLLAPSSEAAQRAKMTDEMQLRFTGCAGGFVGGGRVDPGGLSFSAITVLTLIMVAYGHDCSLVEGGPAWARSGEHYEIQANLPAGTPRYTTQDLAKGNAPELQRMLQNLLADRFRLVVKRELREMPVYTLTVATPGKMKLSPDETMPPPSLPLPGLPPPPGIGRGQKLQFFVPGEVILAGHAISMSELAKDLSKHAGRVVVDKTGLSGVFDYNLNFASEIVSPTAAAAPPTPLPVPSVPPVPTPLPSASVPLRSILEDRLGLKLESARMPIEVLIIESVERPSEN